MAILSQVAMPLALAWTQGDPVSLSTILVGHASWAGAAVIESDVVAIAAMSVTLVADNADVVATFTLPAITSALVPTGEYQYKLRSVGGPILAAGRVLVLASTDDSWTAPPDMGLIVPDDVFDWMETPIAGRRIPQMQLVINAVISRISRSYEPPSVMPNDDWILAHTMQAARIWKRKASPEGVISSDELGTIRVTRLDSDIVDLLTNFQKAPFG